MFFFVRQNAYEPCQRPPMPWMWVSGPARMSDAYGSLTPKLEQIRDVATLVSAG